MVNCVICKNKVEKTFLGKFKGTYFKRKIVCSDCQKKFSKKDLLEKIK